MEKITYAELASIFRHHEYPGAVEHLTGCIVFTEDSFDKPYMGGYSIYGSALDGSDPLVRLERYMAAEKGGKYGWKVDYCYLKQ